MTREEQRRKKWTETGPVFRPSVRSSLRPPVRSSERPSFWNAIVWSEVIKQALSPLTALLRTNSANNIKRRGGRKSEFKAVGTRSSEHAAERDAGTRNCITLESGDRLASGAHLRSSPQIRLSNWKLILFSLSNSSSLSICLYFHTLSFQQFVPRPFHGASGS